MHEITQQTQTLQAKSENRFIKRPLGLERFIPRARLRDRYLIALGTANYRTRTSFASVPDLAAKCGVSTRQMQRDISDWEKLGVVIVVERKLESGNNHSNVYTFVLLNEDFLRQREKLRRPIQPRTRIRSRLGTRDQSRTRVASLVFNTELEDSPVGILPAHPVASRISDDAVPVAATPIVDQGKSVENSDTSMTPPGDINVTVVLKDLKIKEQTTTARVAREEYKPDRETYIPWRDRPHVGRCRMRFTQAFFQPNVVNPKPDCELTAQEKAAIDEFRKRIGEPPLYGGAL